MADKIIVGLCTVLLVACGTFVVLPVLRIFSKRVRHWCCRELGWHDGSRSILEFDGISIHGRCRFCGRQVMMDSNGNWFVIDGR